MPVCKKCNKDLPDKYFYVNRSTNYVLKKCKYCISAEDKAKVLQLKKRPAKKMCYTCKVVKGSRQFSRDARKPDGLHYKCKVCLSAYLNNWRKKQLLNKLKADAEQNTVAEARGHHPLQQEKPGLQKRINARD